MEAATTIFAGGKERILTDHVLERLMQRGIELNWIVQVLEMPVAVVDDAGKNSTNYYGFISGRNILLKIAVAKSDDRFVLTVHFDSNATRRYCRGEL